mgnify:FL=1
MKTESILVGIQILVMKNIKIIREGVIAIYLCCNNEKMNLKHLLIFIEVATCKKMNLAAKRLSLSQPAVSKAILDLEDYYNIKLFERYPRELCITEAGKILLIHAKRVINYWNILEETMKNPTYRKPIQIGVTITIGNNILWDILKNYKSEKIKVIVNNTSKIEEKLLTNELDIGIVEGVIRSNHLILKPILEDRLVLVCGKTHRFYYQNEDVMLEQLENESFIMREEGSGTRDLFVSYIESEGYSINIDWECTETNVIIKGVVDGYGLTVISQRLVQKELEDGSLKVVNLKNFNWARTFNLVYHKNKLLSPDLKEFINLVITNE